MSDPKSVSVKETAPSSIAAPPPTAAVFPVAGASSGRTTDPRVADGVTTESVVPKVLSVTAREPPWPSEEVRSPTYRPPPSSAASLPLNVEESMVKGGGVGPFGAPSR